MMLVTGRQSIVSKGPLLLERLYRSSKNHSIRFGKIKHAVMVLMF